MVLYRVNQADRDGESESGADNVINTDPAQAFYGTFYIGYEGGGSLNIDLGIIVDTADDTVIPAGSTILTATVTLTQLTNDFDAGMIGAWYGFLGSFGDFVQGTPGRISDHATRTTNTVTDSSWADAATHISPSLVTIVQETVDDAGYDGRIGLTWRSTGTTTGWWNWTSYNDNTLTAPLVTITFTPPAGGGVASRVFNSLVIQGPNSGVIGKPQ